MTKKPTILIVDDELINLNILANAFKDQYKLLITKNGSQALNRAMQHDIDLILLDIMLPDMDGFEVCRRLKENSKTRNIPVIFITSKTENTDEELGLQAGAVDYIGKPFYLPIVIARVETHLMLKYKSDLLEQKLSLDGLTCIFNRKRFDLRFDDEYKRAKSGVTPLSLALLDIDCFKHYNDNYGYAAGDKVLKQVTDILQGTVKRSTDVVARYGGGEFAVIMPDMDIREASQYCQQLIEVINGKAIQHLYSGVAKHVTFSIGGATMSKAGDLTRQGFLERTSQMLREAKNNGRNQLVWYQT